MIHIDIVIPFYTYGKNDRIELTKKIFKHYKNIQSYFSNTAKITFTFVGSEGEFSKNMVEHIFTYDYRYIEFFQEKYDLTKLNDYRKCIEMLDKKFIFSYKMSFEVNPDISLLSGSNDYISFLFFQQVINFYNPEEKQIFGIDNYKNGKNSCLILNYSDPSKYFFWDGISEYEGREKFHYCAGIIGFTKTIYDIDPQKILNLLSCDEGEIEYNLLSLPEVKKFNSSNVFYINYKTTSDSELNTYDSLYNKLINKHSISLDMMTEDFIRQYDIENQYIKNNFNLDERMYDIIIPKKLGVNNKFDNSVIIGNNTKIGNNNIIGSNVKIGDNVVIGDNNFIGDNTVIYQNTFIGNDNYIYNKNTIGEFPVHTGDNYIKYNLGICKGVEIGNNNLLHVGNIISTGIENKTIIGNNNKILSDCLISHDVNINDNVTLYPRVSLGGYCILLDKSNIGMCAVLHQKTIVGQYSMIGANNTITKHVFPYFITINNKLHRLNQKKIPSYVDESHDNMLREINNKIKTGNYDNCYDNLEVNSDILNDINLFKKCIKMLEKTKILFCHIPKCSGTNIDNYLSEKYKNDNYKWYIHRILKYDIKIYDCYYKFTIIRDPIEKLVSLYFYQINMINNLKDRLPTFQEGNWHKISNLYKKYNITDITSFLDNYLLFYSNEIQPHIYNLKYINESQNMTFFYIVGYLPQHLFICDDNFNVLVDDIVDIKDCNNFMFKKFGIKIDSEKKINIHPHTNDNYYKYLKPQNIKDIKQIYKEDYKYLFNINIDI